MGYVACQAPLSMGFSRQGHWNGLLNPPPGDLPNPGIKPVPRALQVDSSPSRSEPPGKPLQGSRVRGILKKRGGKKGSWMGSSEEGLCRCGKLGS